MVVFKYGLFDASLYAYYRLFRKYEIFFICTGVCFSHGGAAQDIELEIILYTDKVAAFPRFLVKIRHHFLLNQWLKYLLLYIMRSHLFAHYCNKISEDIVHAGHSWLRHFLLLHIFCFSWRTERNWRQTQIFTVLVRLECFGWYKWHFIM